MKHSAVVAVFDSKGDVLVLRRSGTDTWRPYHWNFPGGRVDPGETIRGAAVREVREESGIILSERKVYYLFSFKPDEGQQVHVFYAVLPRKPRISFDDGEHDRFLWTPINNLPSPVIPRFSFVSEQVALQLLDRSRKMEEGNRGGQAMARRTHWDTSRYLLRWPQMLPYPYMIGRKKGKVPNASSFDWPQAQFAPLYLPASGPSFQPYVYRTKPERYPAGADVFSIFPGPNTLPFSTKLMGTGLRRRWMARPAGDIIRVPYGDPMMTLSNPSMSRPKNGLAAKIQQALRPKRHAQTRARNYTLAQRLAASRQARLQSAALRAEASKRRTASLLWPSRPAVRIGARPAPMQPQYSKGGMSTAEAIMGLQEEGYDVVRKGPYPVDEVPPADAGVTPTPAEELAFVEEENMIMEYLPWIIGGSAILLLLVLRR